MQKLNPDLKQNPETKPSKFPVFWMTLIAILLLIIVITFIILTLFLKAYEQSQPIYSINEYISTISDTKVKTLCEPLLSELSNLQDDSIVVSNMKNSISVCEPVKSSRESNTNETVYYLYDGSKFIEKVTLIPGNDLGFGFKKWVVSSEELLDTELSNSLTVNVPDDYKIYFGDTLLDSSYVTDNKVQYKLLKEFYSEKNIKLPYLVSYVTGDIVGNIDLYAIDNNGERVSYENLNEDYFSDNCNDSEKSSLTTFIDNYITAYVKFLSNADRNTDLNYLNVIQYVESGSTLESTLQDAKKSNGFNSSLGDEIESIDISHYMNCKNNIYMCDVQFTYITTGQNRQKTELTNNMKLLIRLDSDGTYKAISMAQY